MEHFFNNDNVFKIYAPSAEQLSLILHSDK